MRKILLVAGLALLWPAISPAQWKIDDSPVPDQTWRKSDGDFGVMLVLTDKPGEFFAAWEKPTSGVSMSEALTASRGAPIMGVVLFTGCAVNKSGDCDATVTYTVLKPDGTIYGDAPEGELWIGKRPPARNELQLSIGNMGVRIEPGDPLGRYTMRAEVRDRIAGKTLRLERTFDVVEP